MRTFAAALLVLVSAQWAIAQEQYYVTLFSADGSPKIARLSHTFATFTRKRNVGDYDYVDSFTISWMPASMNVRFRLRPEPGKNLTLEATLNYVKSVNGKAFAWGPYQIDKVLHERAFKQFLRLEEGKIMYKMVDFRHKYRSHTASNCIQAVADIVPRNLVETGVLFGESIGPIIAQHISPWVIQPQDRTGWVAESLGLTASEVTFR